MSLFSIRGRRIAGEWVQYIVKCAYLHQVHDTISIYACQRVCQSLWQHSNTEICLIDIVQHPQQHTHTPHAHMHARSHGCTLSFFGANTAAAKWVQCGIAWDCRCAECFFTPGTRVILPMVKSTAAHQQLPNVHPNLSRLEPARPSLSLSGLCAIVRGSFEVSLFSIRGRQIADEWVQCIVNFAYLHQVHDNISIYACQRVCQSLWQHSNTEISFVLDETHWHRINAKVASHVFSLLASVEGTAVCLEIPLQSPPPPPPGHRHLVTVSLSRVCTVEAFFPMPVVGFFITSSNISHAVLSFFPSPTVAKRAPKPKPAAASSSIPVADGHQCYLHHCYLHHCYIYGDNRHRHACVLFFAPLLHPHRHTCALSYIPGARNCALLVVTTHMHPLCSDPLHPPDL